MEDPIQFDLWGVAARPAQRHLRELLELEYASDARAAWARAVARSAFEGTPMLLLSGLDWVTVGRRKDSLAPVAHSLQIYQEGYGPAQAERLAHCAVHDLFYAGCLGCPVCGNRNA